MAEDLLADWGWTEKVPGQLRKAFDDEIVELAVSDAWQPPGATVPELCGRRIAWIRVNESHWARTLQKELMQAALTVEERRWIQKNRRE